MSVRGSYSQACWSVRLEGKTEHTNDWPKTAPCASFIEQPATIVDASVSPLALNLAMGV
jgi:hypothetical protein